MAVTLEGLLSPGVYVSQLVNPRAVNLVTPSVAYMLGTSSNVAAGDVNTPVTVASLAEFQVKFPNSPSLAYVDSYFQQVRIPFVFVNVAKVAAKATVGEFTTALNSLTEREETGVILAPEFFADPTRTDIILFANLMSTLAAELQWLTIIDTPFAARNTVGTDDVTPGSVRAFSASIGASGRPATFVVFPWIVTATGSEIASSAATAGLFVYVWNRFGYATPPAGTSYPLVGVSSTTVLINKSIQDILNPKNINCIRFFRSAPGFVMYGSRMLDGNFLNSRVALNVISATMSDAIQQLVFSNIDSQGLLFIRAKELAESVLYRVYLSRGLAGSSPQQAYFVICDSTNNSSEQLQSGRLVIDIYPTPASTVEVVLVVPHRVTIGGLQAELNNLNLVGN